ncbi:MAG: 3-dehydroquinate synthase [Ginsengibacter sp.]
MTNKPVSEQYHFAGRSVDGYFNADFSMLDSILPLANNIFITDENIFKAHAEKFSGKKTIVIKPGEGHKNQTTVNYLIDELIRLGADRKTFLTGVGGGVVTDITGFVASIYMRGVPFGFAPTSILAMVDASIGGKNGIDVGVYKNLAGVINHPKFLLYDYNFLETLPDAEWINGFSEIIKHACIKDKNMFAFLEKNSLMHFQASIDLVSKLIRKNVDIKYKVVAKDEHETGDRKLLNFGHTIGHAIENTSRLSHGHAVSIGMVAACRISEKTGNFTKEDSLRVIKLLKQYELPVKYRFNKSQAWQTLQHDKKKSGTSISFIILNKIGKASVLPIELQTLKKIFKEISF